MLAVTGGLALAVDVAFQSVVGDPTTTGWLLLGPLPFYAVGLAASLRRPDHPMSTWMLASGTAFTLDTCLNDVVLPEVAGWSWAWVITLVGAWVANLGVIIGLGSIALFPTGVAHTRASRWILRIAALTAPRPGRPRLAPRRPTKPRCYRVAAH